MTNKEKESIPCIRLTCDSCHTSVAYQGQYASKKAIEDQNAFHPDAEGHQVRIEKIKKKEISPDEVVIKCFLPPETEA